VLGVSELFVPVLILFVTAASAQFSMPPAPKKPTGPWMNTSLSPDERADLLVKELTLDEKILSFMRAFQLDSHVSTPLRTLMWKNARQRWIHSRNSARRIVSIKMADATVGGVAFFPLSAATSTPLPSDHGRNLQPGTSILRANMDR